MKSVIYYMIKLPFEKFRLTIFACFFVLVMSSFSWAATYYVAKNGSDTNSGTLERPFATIKKGCLALSQGDTLYIREGRYVEQINVTANGGSEANRITISGYPGETATIDGENRIPGGTTYGVLFNVSGTYVTIQNLRVVNAYGMAVRLQGVYDKAINLYIERSYRQAIIATANNTLIDNCTAYYCGTVNEYEPPGNWPSIVSCARRPDRCTIQNCEVSYSWGEGISAYESTNTTIQNNVSYNNRINYYLSDSTDVLFQGNLGYCSKDNLLSGYVPYQYNLYCSDEKGGPWSDRITVINNLFMGCQRSIVFGYGATPDTVDNSLWAYNTMVDVHGDANIKFNQSGKINNSEFRNNIIRQSDSKPTCISPSQPGITMSNNFWSDDKASVDIDCRGSNDLYGQDPLIAEYGSTNVGSLSRDWFKLTEGSPARNRAMNISEVTKDIFGTPRDSTPDIGAHEYTQDGNNSLMAPTGLRIVQR
jgi:parallel beta-helix repeat protein